MQNKHKCAFREINEEKLQIFNLHYKMKIGKKFITKEMLIVNLIIKKEGKAIPVTGREGP
jgi:hypothetical protein